MKLITILSFGLLGTSKRDISDIVAAFTKVRTELELAIEAEELEIAKAETDKLKADDLSEAKFKEAEEKSAKIIAKAKADAGAKRKKALTNLNSVMYKSIKTIQAAKANITEAEEWLESIPTRKSV